jgi:urease accessory protein
MRALARVVARADGRGGTRLVTLRSEAPLVLRATQDAVYLVGGAGGPLAGDDLTLEVDVGPGAHLTLRSAAASIALPGRDHTPSRISVRATVGAGGELRWLHEPVVAARGCDHRMEAAVDVAAGGRLLWREELVLGRHGESPGSVSSRLHVDVGGLPLLRHELALGPLHPHSLGPAVVGDARAVGSVLLVEPCRGAHAAAVLGPRAAVLALDGPGVQVVALADDVVALRQVMDQASARYAFAV